MAITTIGRARERLLEMVPAEEEPVIELDTVDRVLDEVVRHTVWAASTAYVYGQKVVPSIANGKVYVVTTPGTSGTTEPLWPTDMFSMIVDDEVTWEEAGRAPADGWDIDAAAFKLWLIKASKAAQDYDLSTDGQSFTRDQLHKHCLTMAAQYAPVLFV